MNDPHFRLRACTGETEWAVKQSGRAYTIARPVSFMQNLIGMLGKGAIHTAAGDGRVAMVDARDAAAVTVDALTCRGVTARRTH